MQINVSNSSDAHMEELRYNTILLSEDEMKSLDEGSEV